MFKLFGKREPICPVEETTRAIIEQNFMWLNHTFGEDHLKSVRVLLPEYKDFPIQY